MTNNDKPHGIQSHGPEGGKTVSFTVNNIGFEVQEGGLYDRRDEILALPCDGILPKDAAIWIDGVAFGVAEGIYLALNPPKRFPDTAASQTSAAKVYEIYEDDLVRVDIDLVRSRIYFECKYSEHLARLTRESKSLTFHTQAPFDVTRQNGDVDRAAEKPATDAMAAHMNGIFGSVAAVGTASTKLPDNLLKRLRLVRAGIPWNVVCSLSDQDFHHALWELDCEQRNADRLAISKVDPDTIVARPLGGETTTFRTT